MYIIICKTYLFGGILNDISIEIKFHVLDFLNTLLKIPIKYVLLLRVQLNTINDLKYQPSLWVDLKNNSTCGTSLIIQEPSGEIVSVSLLTGHQGCIR